MKEKHKTFADIVRDVEAEPKYERKLRPGKEKGFTSPEGESFFDWIDVTDTAAAKALAKGARVVIDDCGCGGYCGGLVWPSETDPRRWTMPTLKITKKNTVGWVELWTGENGTSVLCFGGSAWSWS